MNGRKKSGVVLIVVGVLLWANSDSIAARIAGPSPAAQWGGGAYDPTFLDVQMKELRNSNTRINAGLAIVIAAIASAGAGFALLRNKPIDASPSV